MKHPFEVSTGVVKREDKGINIIPDAKINSSPLPGCVVYPLFFGLVVSPIAISIGRTRSEEFKEFIDPLMLQVAQGCIRLGELAVEHPYITGGVLGVVALSAVIKEAGKNISRRSRPVGGGDED